MSETCVAHIGLGANLGDRRQAIAGAIQRLDANPDIAVTAVSTVIETEPEGGIEQGPFLNAVVRVKTTLDPTSLLKVCLDIEAAHGRDRTAERRYGPRTLDLDILLYGDRIIDEPGLTVPHPRLHERAFVLQPLAEIDPALVHPVLGETMERLRVQLALPAQRQWRPVPGDCAEQPVARGRIEEESRRGS